MNDTAAATAPSATVIDGKAFAAGLRQRVGAEVAKVKAEHDLTPGLAVVLVGADPASEVYTRNKAKQTVEAGMNSFKFDMPVETSQHDLLAKVAELNADPAVHGILVQLPLPDQIDEHAVVNAINPDKDVDGFHVVNTGRLATGQDAMVPCTPRGILMLLHDTIGELKGLRALVLGRSNIVGKPMAALLLAEHCTVTMAHSRTRDLAQECRRADILVAAVGQPEMVRGDWIKPGATVIDVGVNRIDAGEGKTRLIGDVAFAEAAQVAGAITPVPGGVGPMTIAVLLSNTLIAACRQHGVAVPEV
ncbi:MAG: bifunctional methylenetetrahydrofolate dehydrogenase/methenyltetrahydrofolate cyclohydrolase FolD [Alphaproteobacteria bacterium]|jgi:methylenetetrahydrofolate dehydrogenase (NADP+)/methenyltetrahydrofolate cyclohydrolase|nr:bifunctional methylenetetrahydrofolate dehydrogenase/methenyltetrahydrofolate cyclohydrolase FolD [Alphaproteobacteria bacterium]HJP21833.1 bifunctional methylenetetrahydrofolate dehydrogenase/methenyltetrahydrofolate cyclohydrolase FolD [Alphaproteobacteria bacterium]